jgi:protein SCO1/2
MLPNLRPVPWRPRPIEPMRSMPRRAALPRTPLRARAAVGTWLSGLIFVAFVILAWQWTNGFSVWTFEARRRILAAQGSITASPVLLADDRGRVQALWTRSNASPVSLVSFVYTRCASVCSVLGSREQDIQRGLEHGAPTSIRLVTISFDDSHDDASALHRYATRYAADPRWWTVAKPVDPRAGAQLREALGVVAVPDPFGGYVHNGDIHLIDNAGRLRGIFDFDDWSQALQTARSVERGRT